MRSAMVSISFRSSLRKGPSSNLGICTRYETSTLPTVSPCTTMLALCTQGVGTKSGGWIGLTFEDDSRLAVVRVLPTRRQNLNDPAKDFLQGKLWPVQQLVHFVEAVQLLGALLQLAKDDADLGVVSGHVFFVGCVGWFRRQHNSATGAAIHPNR